VDPNPVGPVGPVGPVDILTKNMGYLNVLLLLRLLPSEIPFRSFYEIG